MVRLPGPRPDAAASLRRAHLALGEAVLVLRKVSLRAAEVAANVHRQKLAEAQVYEARFHLSRARSLLAVGLVVDEPGPAPDYLRGIPQVLAARSTARRLERLRRDVERELRALAVQLEDPAVASSLPALPTERLPLPAAEGLLYGGACLVLLGVVAVAGGATAAGSAAIALGGLAWFGAADGVAWRR